MCFKTPEAPKVQATPTRDEKATLVQDAKRSNREQSGIMSNIFTSVLGDSEYGKSTRKLAKLGAS